MTEKWSGLLVNNFFQKKEKYYNMHLLLQDYKTYLDFVLALENRKEPQALQYFFRILDLDNKGYLDLFSLKYFFRVRVYNFAFSCKQALRVNQYIRFNLFYRQFRIYFNFISKIQFLSLMSVMKYLTLSNHSKHTRLPWQISLIG